MNAKEWQEIEKARDILGLGESATLAEIKAQYRQASKLYHPDTRADRAGVPARQMHQITAAYELLMRYCNDYRFPLRRENAGQEESGIYDPEDWWQASFGQDPLWSGKKTRQR